MKYDYDYAPEGSEKLYVVFEIRGGKVVAQVDTREEAEKEILRLERLQKVNR